MGTHVAPNVARKVGANLRAARLAKGWTQREVADQIGVQAKDISRWESGSTEPGSKYRLALAGVLFDGDLAALYREPEELTPV